MMLILRRNWRRNVSMLLLTVEGSFMLAVLVSPIWLFFLLAMAYGCGLAVLFYGDFMKGAYDTDRLEAENEVLKATNARLDQLVEDSIVGRQS